MTRNKEGNKKATVDIAVLEKRTVVLSPEVICPFPKILPRKEGNGRGRRKGKTRLLIDTSEKTMCAKPRKHENKKMEQNKSFEEI